MNPLFFTNRIGESLFDWAIANNEHYLIEELKTYYEETNVLSYLLVKKKVYIECITLLYLFKIYNASDINLSNISFEALYSSPIKYLESIYLSKFNKLGLLCSIYDDIGDVDYNVLSTNPLFTYVELLVKNYRIYDAISCVLNEYGKINILKYFHISITSRILSYGDDKITKRLDDEFISSSGTSMLSIDRVLAYGCDTPLMRSIIDSNNITNICNSIFDNARYSNIELHIYAHKKHKISLTSYEFIRNLYTIHRHYARKHLKFIFSRMNCAPDNVKMVATIKKIIKIVHESCDVDTARLIGEYCHWKTYTFREHINFVNGLKRCGYLS
jgi:hypothetical protein